jgi:hypothetical protein
MAYTSLSSRGRRATLHKSPRSAGLARSQTRGVILGVCYGIRRRGFAGRGAGHRRGGILLGFRPG